MLWSQENDLPASNGMSRKEFENFYARNFGKIGLDFKLERVERRGCSSVRDELSSLLNFCPLTKEQLIEKYCHNKHF